MAKYALAVLHDPKEELPCSSVATLKHLGRLAEKLSVDVELITKKDIHRLPEFDALFIRETTFDRQSHLPLRAAGGA